MVTASYDNTVRLWDVNSATLLKTFRGSTATVRTVALSTDGRFILAGGDDHSARVWNVDSGSSVLDLTGHSGVVQACAISADGRLAVSGGADRGMIVWCLSNEAEAPLVRGGAGRYAAVSDDGRMVTFDLAAGMQPGKKDRCAATIFDAASGLPVFSGDVSTQMQAGRRAVLTRADDGTTIGTFLVAPSGDAQVKEKITVNGDNSLTFHTDKDEVSSTVAHAGAVRSVRLSADERLAVSASDDQTAKTWDLATGALVASFSGHTNYVTDAAFRPDGAVVATGSCDCTVRLWDLKPPREIRCFNRRHPCQAFDCPDANRVESVNFSPDGQRLFVGYPGEETEIWDFGRPGQYREMELQLDRAASRFAATRGTPRPCGTLGEWYELRGAWGWAAEVLSTSRTDAGADDSARIARCYWLAGNGDQAMPQLQARWKRRVRRRITRV